MTPTHWGAPDTPAPEPERLVGAERWCHLEGRTSSGRRITFRAGEGERLQVLQDGRWRSATDAEAILLGSSEEGLSWARQHLDAGELYMVVPYTPRDPEAAPWRFPEGALEAVAAFWRRSCSAALGNGGRPPLGWPPVAGREAAVRAVDLLIAQDKREPGYQEPGEDPWEDSIAAPGDPGCPRCLGSGWIVERDAAGAVVGGHSCECARRTAGALGDTGEAE